MTKIAQNYFGTVEPPPGVERFGGELSGLSTFLSVVFRTMVMGAGLYTLLNVILAGYDYLSADGDIQKIKSAGSRITRSFWGLLVASGSFLLAAVIGLLFFGDSNALLQVEVFGP